MSQNLKERTNLLGQPMVVPSLCNFPLSSQVAIGKACKVVITLRIWRKAKKEIDACRYRIVLLKTGAYSVRKLLLFGFDEGSCYALPATGQALESRY